MFWEVGVDHGRIAFERSEMDVVFHMQLDAVFSEIAIHLFHGIQMLVLIALLCAITALSFAVQTPEPVLAYSCFYFAVIFFVLCVSKPMARVIAVTWIERAWVKRFLVWFEESDYVNLSPPKPDLDYLRAFDPRLDLVMSRADLGARKTQGSWVQPDDMLYPGVSDTRFFLSFWSKRSETGALLFFVAGLLILLDFSITGMVLGAFVAIAAGVMLLQFIWHQHRSSTLMIRYLSLFHAHSLRDEFSEVRFGMVSEGTLRQFRAALGGASEERIRYWTRRVLSDLLAPLDSYLYATLLVESVAPKLRLLFGRKLGPVAEEVIAEFPDYQ